MGAKPGLLVLTSTYPRWAGDTEPSFIHELSRRLAADFDVRVLAPHAPGAADRENLDGVDVVRYHYLPKRWETLAYGGGIPAKLRREPWRFAQVPFFVLGLLVAAWREVRRPGTAIVHAHWLLPQGLVAVLLAALLPGTRAVVCTAHGADLYTQRGLIGRMLKTWVLRRADLLTVVSRSMLVPARELGARGPIEVASMGADLEHRFVPGDGERDRNRLLFAGRLVEKKGVVHLLDAFARAHARRPDLRLVIAGDGPERIRLQQHAARLGVADGVEFPGAVPQEQLAGMFRSAAMAVFPFVDAADGDREGLGLVVIEAQGCACPVIASDIPAVRDTIVDGESGLLVPSGNAAALADRIVSLLENPDQAGRLGANGRRSALEAFDWKLVAGRYTRILLNALKR